ncbi:hypothetical protein E4U60_003738 [Claviceps pazoutovae]|uniref:Uncharacterized protein n=1 Tax=Claviceps pazoutovae TaxID=1649127 RepID=A0A9P7SK06_9HYPO|nr:hypothetical protein E4U60_003738 [Claviceps pazoutovae]
MALNLTIREAAATRGYVSETDFEAYSRAERAAVWRAGAKTREAGDGDGGREIMRTLPGNRLRGERSTEIKSISVEL